MNWLGFTNPWMLAGLAAAGLPVLIHFLTRARPRRIAFPPFKFLVEACAGQQRLHRLRTILLLAVRCLAVLALVLLFARPFLKPSGAATQAEAARRIVLVIDASLSMRSVERGVTLFSRAQGEAADVLRDLDAGAEAGVILAGATPRALLPALSRNLPALHDELVKSSPTFEAGAPAAALAFAARMLNGQGTIYVFSDFQKTDWEGIEELPAGVTCRLRRVGNGSAQNAAITEIQVLPAEPLAGEATEVVCTVFNSTAQPRQETVQLVLGDFTHEKGIIVPPFGSSKAAFSVTPSQSGPVCGKASISPDDLPEDNTRSFVVNVSRTLPILLISDAEQADSRSAAFYIRHALAPSPQSAPGLNIQRRHSQDADRGVLETADLFVLAAPALLSGEAVEIISRRVNEGARLMVFLDGPTAPALIPAGFQPPFLLQRPVNSQEGDNLQAGPRFLFAEGDAAEFGAARFHRHFSTQLRPEQAENVMLAYPDGSAAVVCSDIGQGRGAFINLPLTPEGTDFIGSPLFPAMVHELLHALRRSPSSQNLTPGIAWMMDAQTPNDEAVVVTGPDGARVSARVVTSGRVTRLAMPPAVVPGAYRASQGGTLIAARPINSDPRESDLRPIAVERLKSGASSSVSVLEEGDEVMLGGRNRPLWPQLALAAAALLAIEMLLLSAWRRPATVPSGILRKEVAM